HDALLKAQKDGVGFNEFKKGLKATLSDKGWYGKKDIVNPLTGEVRSININSSRLKTIYTTNMQRAYNLSRAKVMMNYTYKTYWLYKSAKLSTSRSSHSKMHNVAIHKDDAW
ncbi:phage minor head protein, partial [Campylobacter sp. RM12647]